LIQAEDPKSEALCYVNQLGFEITGETPDMISLEGRRINLYIEPGPAPGPALEVTVGDVGVAKQRLAESGCEIVKDEPKFPNATSEIRWD